MSRIRTIAEGIRNSVAKKSARVSTTTNLTATYANGTSGVGATLTNSGTLAAISIDGLALALGDRVLVRHQSTTYQNGIYYVTTVGSGSVAWVLTRDLDANTPWALAGALINIEEGTYGGLRYDTDFKTTDTIGSTAVTWYENSDAGKNLSFFSSSYSNTTTDALTITANSLTTAVGLAVSANALTSGSGISITTAASSINSATISEGLYIERSGTYATGAHNARGIHSKITATGTVTKYAGHFETTGTGTANYGVYATASGGTANYAGYFSGNVELSGGSRLTLASGTGVINQTYTGTTTPAMQITANSLTSAAGIKITTTSTARVSGAATFEVVSSGVNGTSSVTVYGVYSSVTNTGTSSTNTAIYATASGASTNYALYANAGSVHLEPLTASRALVLDANKNIAVAGANLTLSTALTVQTGAVTLTGQAGGSSVTLPSSGLLAATTSATGSLLVPASTEGNRDGSPAAGYFRFNTTVSKFEGYNGTAWGSVGGGATGAGADEIFILNGQTVTGNYDIPSGKNAGTFGPVTINTGVTVTVPTGSVWTIV